MKRLVLVGLLSGCATSWIITQASGTQRVWDESVTEATVPQPGIDETLAVAIPLGVDRVGATTVPFEISCRVAQKGRDLVAHSAFRYGGHWKLGVAISVALEAGFAALGLLSADKDHQQNYLYGGFFAADAIVALPLILIPRREIYREESRPVITEVRADCPDALVLEIGREPYPIDAAGHIGELGEAALAEWMSNPHDGMRVTLAGQGQDLVVGAAEQCVWLREHGTTTNCLTGAYAPRVVATTFHVVAGSLTRTSN